MTIVLDSNILLIAVGRRSRYRPIWDAFTNGKYSLAISEEIVHEYEEILLEHGAPGVADIVMEIFVESPDIVFKRVYYQWNAITNDADDNKFFDVAIASNAHFLVTDDTHFNLARELPFPQVPIINADEFLDLVEKL